MSTFNYIKMALYYLVSRLIKFINYLNQNAYQVDRIHSLTNDEVMSSLLCLA